MVVYELVDAIHPSAAHQSVIDMEVPDEGCADRLAAGQTCGFVYVARMVTRNIKGGACSGATEEGWREGQPKGQLVL